jgi:hypothetical protein
VNLPMAQCSRGTIQSRPYPARTLKVMESAGQHNANGGAEPRTDCEREGVATTSHMASGIIFSAVSQATLPWCNRMRSDERTSKSVAGLTDRRRRESNFPSVDARSIVNLLGNLEQPPGRNTARRAGTPGSSQSGHWIERSLSFMAPTRRPLFTNHRRLALPASNRLSRKQAV